MPAMHAEIPIRTRLTDRTEPVILRAVRGATLEVTVTDGERNVPVAGATITLRGEATRDGTAGRDGGAGGGGGPGGYHVAVSVPGYAVAHVVCASPGSLGRPTCGGFVVLSVCVGDCGRLSCAPVAEATVSLARASNWGSYEGEERGDHRRARAVAIRCGRRRQLPAYRAPPALRQRGGAARGRRR